MRERAFHRVPVVLQMEAAECGAASLAMILGYYGRYEELTVLRRACGTTRDGSRLSHVMKAAEAYGLETDARRAGAELKGIRLPAIVFWNNNHFLVAERMTDSAVLLCDPARGRVRVSREEFAEGFSGVVLQLKPGPDFRRGGKPFRSRSVIRSLFRGKGGVFFFLAVMSLLLNLVGTVIPGLTSLFVDYYLPMLQHTSLTAYFAVFAVLLLLQLGISGLRMRIVARFERIQTAMTNAGIMRKLLRLPMSFFQSRSHTGVLSRLGTIDQLAEFLSSRLVPVIMGIVFTLVYFVLLFYYSVTIGLGVLAIIALLVAMLALLLRSGLGRANRVTNTMADFFSTTVQSLRLFDTVKSTATEDAAVEQSMCAYVEFENAAQQMNGVTTLMQAIPAVAPLLIQLFIITVGGFEAAGHRMTIGTVLACQSIGMSVFAPIAEFISEYSSFQTMDSDICGLHDIEAESDDPVSGRQVPREKERLEGRITFEHVTFGYNPAMPPVLRDVSFDVLPGRSFAVVGGSGSGKTTLLRLLEGLYVPDAGRILLDGVPLTETNRDMVTESVSVISQGSALFNGTVRDNITLFDPTIPMERVRRAAEDACIADDIEEKSNGMNERIDVNSCGFSGGQVQRIAIARALVREPSVLILDEATGALDPLTEEKVMRNIRGRGITLIIVAHRLSTVRDCDMICVLKDGAIAERGTHDELMAPGFHLYRRLVLSEKEGTP